MSVREKQAAVGTTVRFRQKSTTEITVKARGEALVPFYVYSFEPTIPPYRIVKLLYDELDLNFSFVPTFCRAVILYDNLSVLKTK